MFNGVGNSCAVPKGYVEFNLQVLGVSHFNQDHVALLVKDESKFAKKIPLIHGTRTLDCVVENLLESEEDELSTTWKRAKVVHSLARKFQELGCHVLNDGGELELERHDACLSNKDILDLLSHKEIIQPRWNIFPHDHKRMHATSSMQNQNEQDDRTAETGQPSSP